MEETDKSIEKEQEDKEIEQKDDDKKSEENEEEWEDKENQIDPNDIILTEEEKQRSQEEFYTVDENCDDLIDFQELKELLASTLVIRTWIHSR